MSYDTISGAPFVSRMTNGIHVSELFLRKFRISVPLLA